SSSSGSPGANTKPNARLPPQREPRPGYDDIGRLARSVKPGVTFSSTPAAFRPSWSSVGPSTPTTPVSLPHRRECAKAATGNVPYANRDRIVPRSALGFAAAPSRLPAGAPGTPAPSGPP